MWLGNSIAPTGSPLRIVEPAPTHRSPGSACPSSLSQPQHWEDPNWSINVNNTCHSRHKLLQLARCYRPQLKYVETSKVFFSTPGKMAPNAGKSRLSLQTCNGDFFSWGHLRSPVSWRHVIFGHFPKQPQNPPACL